MADSILATNGHAVETPNHTAVGCIAQLSAADRTMTVTNQSTLAYTASPTLVVAARYDPLHAAPLLFPLPRGHVVTALEVHPFERLMAVGTEAHGVFLVPLRSSGKGKEGGETPFSLDNCLVSGSTGPGAVACVRFLPTFSSPSYLLTAAAAAGGAADDDEATPLVKEVSQNPLGSYYGGLAVATNHPSGQSAMVAVWGIWGPTRADRAIVWTATVATSVVSMTAVAQSWRFASSHCTIAVCCATDVFLLTLNAVEGGGGGAPASVMATQRVGAGRPLPGRSAAAVSVDGSIQIFRRLSELQDSRYVRICASPPTDLLYPPSTTAITDSVSLPSTANVKLYALTADGMLVEFDYSKLCVLRFMNCKLGGGSLRGATSLACTDKMIAVGGGTITRLFGTRTLDVKGKVEWNTTGNKSKTATNEEAKDASLQSLALAGDGSIMTLFRRDGTLVHYSLVTPGASGSPLAGSTTMSNTGAGWNASSSLSNSRRNNRLLLERCGQSGSLPLSESPNLRSLVAQHIEGLTRFDKPHWLLGGHSNNNSNLYTFWSGTSVELFDAYLRTAEQSCAIPLCTSLVHVPSVNCLVGYDVQAGAVVAWDAQRLGEVGRTSFTKALNHLTLLGENTSRLVGLSYQEEDDEIHNDTNEDHDDKNDGKAPSLVMTLHYFECLESKQPQRVSAEESKQQHPTSLSSLEIRFISSREILHPLLRPHTTLAFAAETLCLINSTSPKAREPSALVWNTVSGKPFVVADDAILAVTTTTTRILLSLAHSSSVLIFDPQGMKAFRVGVAEPLRSLCVDPELRFFAGVTEGGSLVSVVVSSQPLDDQERPQGSDSSVKGIETDRVEMFHGKLSGPLTMGKKSQTVVARFTPEGIHLPSTPGAATYHNPSWMLIGLRTVVSAAPAKSAAVVPPSTAKLGKYAPPAPALAASSSKPSKPILSSSPKVGPLIAPKYTTKANPVGSTAAATARRRTNSCGATDTEASKKTADLERKFAELEDMWGATGRPQRRDNSREGTPATAGVHKNQSKRRDPMHMSGLLFSTEASLQQLAAAAAQQQQQQHKDPTVSGEHQPFAPVHDDHSPIYRMLRQNAPLRWGDRGDTVKSGLPKVRYCSDSGALDDRGGGTMMTVDESREVPVPSEGKDGANALARPPLQWGERGDLVKSGLPLIRRNASGATDDDSRATIIEEEEEENDGESERQEQAPMPSRPLRAVKASSSTPSSPSPKAAEPRDRPLLRMQSEDLVRVESDLHQHDVKEEKFAGDPTAQATGRPPLRTHHHMPPPSAAHSHLMSPVYEEINQQRTVSPGSGADPVGPSSASIMNPMKHAVLTMSQSITDSVAKAVLQSERDRITGAELQQQPPSSSSIASHTLAERRVESDSNVPPPSDSPRRPRKAGEEDDEEDEGAARRHSNLSPFDEDQDFVVVSASFGDDPHQQRLLRNPLSTVARLHEDPIAFRRSADPAVWMGSTKDEEEEEEEDAYSHRSRSSQAAAAPSSSRGPSISEGGTSRNNSVGRKGRILMAPPAPPPAPVSWAVSDSVSVGGIVHHQQQSPQYKRAVNDHGSDGDVPLPSSSLERRYIPTSSVSPRASGTPSYNNNKIQHGKKDPTLVSASSTISSRDLKSQVDNIFLEVEHLNTLLGLQLEWREQQQSKFQTQSRDSHPPGDGEEGEEEADLLLQQQQDDEEAMELLEAHVPAIMQHLLTTIQLSNSLRRVVSSSRASSRLGTPAPHTAWGSRPQTNPNNNNNNTAPQLQPRSRRLTDVVQPPVEPGHPEHQPPS